MPQDYYHGYTLGLQLLYVQYIHGYGPACRLMIEWMNEQAHIQTAE